MFDSYVDAFGDDSLSDLFVDDDADGPGVDVEDSSSSAVVVLVGHAFVNGSVHHDVHDVSYFVGGQGFGDVDGSVLFEAFFEFVSGSAFVSVAVGHRCGDNIMGLN